MSEQANTNQQQNDTSDRKPNMLNGIISERNKARILERQNAKAEKAETHNKERKEKLEDKGKEVKSDAEETKIKPKREAVEQKKEEVKEPIKRIEPKKVEIVEEDDDDEPSEIELLKRDFEKTKKSLADTKKWGHANSQKLKTAIKKINALVDSSILTAEEAQDLTDQLNTEGTEEDIAVSDNLTPMQLVYRTANKELEHIKKYTDDDTLGDKIAAFDFYITDCDTDEREEILEDLENLRERDPLKMTKKMISLGAQYYEEVYKEFKEVGGYKKFSASKNDEIARLQKKVDKLTRRLSQYEEYDEPARRINELADISGDPNMQAAPKSTIGQILRDRNVRRKSGRNQSQ